MKTLIIQLIQSYALQYGVDPQIAVSVAQLESGLNVRSVGITGDLGVFQLNPRSFPNYSTEELLEPITNIQLGVQYLAHVKKNCIYRQGLNWLVCWNAGPAYAKRIRHPSKFPYVKKISRYLKDAGNGPSLLVSDSQI